MRNCNAIVFGKILGAIVGVMLGLAFSSGAAAVVLAGLGVLIGHRIDQLHAPGEDAPLDPPVPEPTRRAASEEAESRAQFGRHLCALFIEVARADGEVVQDEIRVVREFFAQDLHFRPTELDRVRDDLKAAIATPHDLEVVARQCHRDLTPSEQLLLLNALYELAIADGGLKKSEGEAIKRVVAGLEISEADHRSITAMHFGEGTAHYAVLGLAAESSDEEVKLAFRRLAATHHPDKVAHLGPGAVEVAARRFREIKDAYDEIRRRRGI